MEAIKEGKQISEVARKLKRRRGDTHVVENVREKEKKGERERGTRWRRVRGQAGDGNLISGTHSPDVSLFSLFSSDPLRGRLLSSGSESLSDKGHLQRQAQLSSELYFRNRNRRDECQCLHDLLVNRESRIHRKWKERGGGIKRSVNERDNRMTRTSMSILVGVAS